jgi:hypothetical protein
LEFGGGSAAGCALGSAEDTGIVDEDVEVGFAGGEILDEAAGRGCRSCALRREGLGRTREVWLHSRYRVLVRYVAHNGDDLPGNPLSVYLRCRLQFLLCPTDNVDSGSVDSECLRGC